MVCGEAGDRVRGGGMGCGWRGDGLGDAQREMRGGGVGERWGGLEVGMAWVRAACGKQEHCEGPVSKSAVTPNSSLRPSKYGWFTHSRLVKRASGSITTTLCDKHTHHPVQDTHTRSDEHSITQPPASKTLQHTPGPLASVRGTPAPLRQRTLRNCMPRRDSFLENLPEITSTVRRASGNFTPSNLSVCKGGRDEGAGIKGWAPLERPMLVNSWFTYSPLARSLLLHTRMASTHTHMHTHTRKTRAQYCTLGSDSWFLQGRASMAPAAS
jgi:hypothetical protein